MADVVDKRYWTLLSCHQHRKTVALKRARTQTSIKDRKTAKVYEMLYNETMLSMEFNDLRVFTKEWSIDY